MVIVPDRCGEGEDALQDADGDPADGVSLVVFEVGLPFSVSLIDSMTFRNGLNYADPARSGSPLRGWAEQQDGALSSVRRVSNEKLAGPD